MLEKYPLMNEYWASKRVDISKITVPAYILASYSTFLHTFGSFRGFVEIPHEKKWYILPLGVMGNELIPPQASGSWYSGMARSISEIDE